MIAATVPVQRPADARLLSVDALGRLTHMARPEFVHLLRKGDVVVANDAATLPALLNGQHLPSGRRIEVRLAGRDALSPDTIGTFRAILFGLGDFRMRTEDRPLPPEVHPGDRLALGPLRAVVTRVIYAPRLVELKFEGTPGEIWAGLVRHGRPIQYSHVPTRLAIWDTWTPFAGLPVAFEPPSAGFALDWLTIAAITGAGIRFETITHAAGISSTGDPELDAMLPFDEPYRIPEATARTIERARARGGRIVAIGTTVVRALEHASDEAGSVMAGEGVATGRIDGSTRLRVVDALLSGTHERGSSHYELLRAFTDDVTLAAMDRELLVNGYRTHEFGDSVFVEARSGQW